MIKGTLAWARHETIRLHRVRWAILLLGNALSAEETQTFMGDEQENNVRRCNNRRTLEKLIVTLKSEIAELRTRFRVHATDDALLDSLSIMRGGPDQPGNGILFISVHYLNTYLLNHYAELPPHFRVGVDPQGLRPLGSPLEVRALDATLFEDLAGLFNLSVQHHDLVRGRYYPKAPFKLIQSLFRATTISAFHFVEGYINGVAFDHFAKNEPSLSPSERSLIMEYDFDRKRTRHVSLRDKLLQYPKIALGFTSPPLQESNCPELRHILAQSKAVRDSIVHSSPMPVIPAPENVNAQNLNMVTKEEQFYSINKADLEKTVDSAVGLVDKIHRLLNNDLAAKWLHRRGDDGLFPPRAFD